MNSNDERLSREDFEKIMKRLESIDGKIDRINKVNEVLDGDKLLDNQDLCLLMGITKRTLQRYRHLRKITYLKIEGKMCYRTSDVKEFLKNFEVRRKED